MICMTQFKDQSLDYVQCICIVLLANHSVMVASWHSVEYRSILVSELNVIVLITGQTLKACTVYFNTINYTYIEESNIIQATHTYYNSHTWFTDDYI